MHSESMDMLAPAELAPFVTRLWYSAAPASPLIGHEHVLPTGQMHLVLRLSGPSLQVWPTPGCSQPQIFRGLVLGGARTCYYRKHGHGPGASIGALLAPGAAMALFGVDAGELAHRHTALADIWGVAAQVAAEQIDAARNPREKLAVLARILTRRLRQARPLEGPAQQALQLLHQGRSVAQVVAHSGYSHRVLLTHFRQATGLTPKALSQVWRMQDVLQALRPESADTLAQLALDCGFSDQAHLSRAFRAFAGVTPQEYRRLAPRHRNHVMLAAASGQFSSIRPGAASLSCSLTSTTGALHGS